MNSAFKAVATAGLALTLIGALAAAQQQPGQGMGGMSGMGMGGMNMSMGPGGMRMTMPGMPQMNMGPGCMMMGHAPAGMGAMSGMDGMPGMGMGGAMTMGPTLEQRLMQIRSQLAITEVQGSAWDSYARTVMVQSETSRAQHESMMKAMHEGTAVQRLDVHIAALDAMATSLKALKPATEALYGVLDDRQKQIAGMLLDPGCPM